jgi:hypothetical protein
LSTTEASAPWPAAPVTKNASFSIASPSASAQPPAKAGAPADPSGGIAATRE